MYNGVNVECSAPLLTVWFALLHITQYSATTESFILRIRTSVIFLYYLKCLYLTWYYWFMAAVQTIFEDIMFAAFMSSRLQHIYRAATKASRHMHTDSPCTSASIWGSWNKCCGPQNTSSPCNEYRKGTNCAMKASKFMTNDCKSIWRR